MRAIKHRASRRSQRTSRRSESALAPPKRASLEPGDHVCALYSTTEELADLVADFLVPGLARNERCWYVAAGSEGAAVRAALRRRGIDVDAESRRGALAVIAGAASYVVRGHFDAERTVQVFSDAIDQAFKDGFAGFRAAADMSWALTLSGGSEIVIAYEAMLKSLFATCRVTGLCLYHRHRIPSPTLDGALLTHPIAGTNGILFENPFYDPDVRSLAEIDPRAAQSRLQTFEWFGRQ